MNILTGEQASTSNPDQRDLAMNEPPRRQAELRRAKTENLRTEPDREEPPGARDTLSNEDPPAEPAGGIVEAKNTSGKTILMGSDTASPKPALGSDRLAPLFAQDVANSYRARWVVVQQGFVDDPNQAVKEGDDLVRQVLKTLEESFSKEQGTVESQLGTSDKASTEVLRVALRRYRSFFERLLSV
jgi:hypothetical protein